MKQFTEQEKEDIAQDYLINYNIQKLAKKYQVSSARIRTVLKNKKVTIISDRKDLWKKRFPRNSNVFEKIDTFAKAYWLGFLYADGNIQKATNTLRINLSTIDEDHLIKFKKFIGASNTEIKRNDKKDIINNKIYEISYFSLSDEKIVNDLINKGCIENKTYSLTFPTEEILPKEFQYHFIRGFFDGDGSIYEDKKRNRVCINFTGTADMLNSIKHIFGKDNIKLENKNNFSVLHLDGNKQVMNILTKIYENSSEEIVLSRKFEKFKKFQ